MKIYKELRSVTNQTERLMAHLDLKDLFEALPEVITTCHGTVSHEYDDEGSYRPYASVDHVEVVDDELEVIDWLLGQVNDGDSIPSTLIDPQKEDRFFWNLTLDEVLNLIGEDGKLDADMVSDWLSESTNDTTYDYISGESIYNIFGEEFTLERSLSLMPEEVVKDKVRDIMKPLEAILNDGAG